MKNQDSEALYQALGNLVRRHRRQREDMTQEKLGEIVGLSRTSITNVEKGRQPVALHQLYAMAEALRVRPEALLPSPREVAGTPGLAGQLSRRWPVDYFNSLSDSDQEGVVKSIWKAYAKVPRFPEDCAQEAFKRLLEFRGVLNVGPLPTPIPSSEWYAEAKAALVHLATGRIMRRAVLRDTYSGKGVIGLTGLTDNEIDLIAGPGSDSTATAEAEKEIAGSIGEPQLDTLRAIPFFCALNEQVFVSLSKHCRIRDYAARETIIGHKEQSFDVLFLLTGLARVSIYSPGGRQVSFRDITPGAIFGELTAIDGEARSASVECIEACTAAIMPRQAFLKALGDHPAFMMAVMKHLTGQVRSLTARVFEFSTLAVRNRVQTEILRLAGAVPGKNEAVLSPAPTHAEIANRISTHREAVTLELGWLEEKGFIVKEGRVLRVKNLEGLRKLVEDFKLRSEEPGPPSDGTASEPRHFEDRHWSRLLTILRSELAGESLGDPEMMQVLDQLHASAYDDVSRGESFQIDHARLLATLQRKYPNGSWDMGKLELKIASLCQNADELRRRTSQSGLLGERDPEEGLRTRASGAQRR